MKNLYFLLFVLGAAFPVQAYEAALIKNTSRRIWDNMYCGFDVEHEDFSARQRGPRCKLEFKGDSLVFNDNSALNRKDVISNRCYPSPVQPLCVVNINVDGSAKSIVLGEGNYRRNLSFWITFNLWLNGSLASEEILPPDAMRAD